MAISLKRRTLWYSLIILLGLLSALPSFLTLLPARAEPWSQHLPDWYLNNTLQLGLDLRGGSQLLLAVDTSELEDLTPERLNDLMTQSVDVVRRRLDETGLVEPSITRQGQDAILVQLPGVDDPQQIKALLGTTAQMNFHWTSRAGSTETITLRDANDEHRTYRLEARPALAGRHVSDARMALQAQTGQPVVAFSLDSDGARLFANMTRDNIGRALAIVLDDEVITAPVIRSPITGGQGEISGQFTAVEAGELAMLLRAGALPVELDVIEERSVGPGLGSDAINMGLLSGALGALLVLLFMVTAYGRWGLIACLGLAVNMGLILGVLSVLGATLTLPGIAGLILVMGMAVDANILINERIRDESRQGKGPWLSLQNGFNRAYSTIVDSNVTTLIAISLLFLMGSGPIRGFAITMGIGLLTSMFTAVAVNRVVMEWLVHRRPRQALNISGLTWMDRLSAEFGGGKRVIRFTRMARTGLLVSALLSSASLALFVSPGLNYGIDFSGGVQVEVHTAPADINTLRNQLNAAGLTDISIQQLDSDQGSAWLLRQALHETQSGQTPQLDQLRGSLNDVLSDSRIERAEMVGPRVSGDFADLSILAVMLAGAGMLGYLWLRFENHFALAAVATIALDITKTIGFFALTGIEFNLTAIAAVLALIGYSVNDKVVVFDRMREWLRARPDMALDVVIDRSISATLSRTLNTSVSTLVAIVPMALLGGPAIASFAWPMVFGIVVSTSSSLFIAAPLILHLGRRRERLGLPQLRTPAEPAGTTV